MKDGGKEEGEHSLDAYKRIVDQAEKNGSLDEIKEVLEKKVEEGKATPEILFTLSMVYERKGMKRAAYEMLVRVEEKVKQTPKIAYNLSLVYGRKETLKSQIEKAESEAFALTHGSISVKSDPSGAYVYLNGEKRGATPLVIESLEEGEYIISLKKEDYEDINQKVTVKAQKTNEIKKSLNCCLEG